MIEKLNIARELLNLALDAYIGVCSTIQNQCTLGTTSDDTPPLDELVSCAANELLLFASFKSKLKKAKAVMSVARNCSTSLVPIHALPSEILSRIFQLVLDNQNCIGKDVIITPPSYTSPGPEFPKYPDLLSLVCYRWRQIAIGSATLWSHIDIAPNYRFSKRLLIRAKGYAARAGKSLLDIHVADCESSSQSDSVDVVEFLRSIATRIWSLELAASNASADFHHSIIHCCLSNCIPGRFTHFSVAQNFGPKFIEAAGSPLVETGENPYRPKSILLDIPQSSFEDILLSVTSLRLSGLYPYWTSKAYLRLVELRLFPLGKYNPPPITEFHLVGILMASPKLRVLYFNLEITEPQPKDASISPIHLDDLEVLNLGLLSHNELAIILRWVAPGSNPLQLSFKLYGSSDGSRFDASSESTTSPDWSILSPANEVHRFLARSNVSKLYLKGLSGNLTHVTEVLQLTPNLRVLALDLFSSSRNVIPAVNRDEHNAKTTLSPHLDHLYMLRCSFNPSSLKILEQILGINSAQQLTLWDCRYFHDKNSRHDIDEDPLPSIILSTYPAAKFHSRHGPSPIEHWES